MVPCRGLGAFHTATDVSGACGYSCWALTAPEISENGNPACTPARAAQPDRLAMAEWPGEAFKGERQQRQDRARITATRRITQFIATLLSSCKRGQPIESVKCRLILGRCRCWAKFDGEWIVEVS